MTIRRYPFLNFFKILKEAIVESAVRETKKNKTKKCP